jgi:hypothetical protein
MYGIQSPNPFEEALHRWEVKAYLDAVDAGTAKMPSFLWAIRDEMRAFVVGLP